MTTVFMTGASGLIGRQVAALLTSASGDRRPARVHSLARSSAVLDPRVHRVVGDLGRDALGIAREERLRLAREVTTIVHLAANTSFSQTLADARDVNTAGTRRVLELAAEWPSVTRFVYVSTAFVAGLRTGRVLEEDAPASAWANAYEQSKSEAEHLVRAARTDWVIVRPATIVCDDSSGAITQMNAVHRALRLYFGGLAPMLPGTERSRVDVITTDYAARGVALAAVAPDVARRTLHLCAGTGAMPLDELLDVTYDAFQRAPGWRRKGIVRPVRTDLDTYRIFERAAFDAGSERVKQALRSLSHFVPQLAYPKTFDTTLADALLYPAPTVACFWTQMVDHLVGNAAAQAAGEAA